VFESFRADSTRRHLTDVHPAPWAAGCKTGAGSRSAHLSAVKQSMTATLVRLGEDTFSALAPASIIEDVLLPLAVADQGLEEARKARPDEERRPEDAQDRDLAIDPLCRSSVARLFKYSTDGKTHLTTVRTRQFTKVSALPGMGVTLRVARRILPANRIVHGVSTTVGEPLVSQRAEFAILVAAVDLLCISKRMTDAWTCNHHRGRWWRQACAGLARHPRPCSRLGMKASQSCLWSACRCQSSTRARSCLTL
jgi:hypothetical protein